MVQLAKLYVETKAKLGEEKSLLFQIHQMMLEDLDYRDTVTSIIRNQHVNAEYAVDQTAAQFSEMFTQMDDDYMKERAADVLDVSRRVIRLLTGQEDEELGGGEPCIIAADDLAPSETARLDQSKVLCFITARGSSNSHAAIFARTMGIPAVVGLGDSLLEEFDGRDVFVDGGSGEVFVEPDSQATAELEARRDKETAHRHYLDAFRGREAITPDGHRILVCANIGAPKDLEAVQDADADGIGLFRSEFLYLGRDNYPPRRISTGPTARFWRPWTAAWWSSVPWTSARTSRPTTLNSPRRRTRPWACGPSASAWPGQRCSAPSYGHCTVPPPMESWALCSP